MLDVVKITKIKTCPAASAFVEIHKVYSTRVMTVSKIHIVNVLGAAHTVQLCFVPPQTTPGVTNAILWDKSIPAYDFIEFGEGDIIDKDFQIMAAADAANAIKVWLFGTEE